VLFAILEYSHGLPAPSAGELLVRAALVFAHWRVPV
jgi:hypothetical protein